MKRLNKEIGSYGEAIASKYLLNKGYALLHNNFSCKFGEIDIVALRGDIISFIEVKSRYDSLFGEPKESITYFKCKRIIRSAEYYLLKNKLYNYLVRFDVIEIKFNRNNSNYTINFLEDAFRCY